MTSNHSANLNVLSDKAAVAAAVAKDIVAQIKQSESAFCIALSGGSTPKILFAELVKNHASSVDWHRVKFFWGDERCVAPDDEQSNYKMTNELLLQPLQIKPGNIFRVRGEDRPQEEAVRYAQQIKDEVTSGNNGLPEFDYMLLGMGADGHTASIFPHEMELLSCEPICAVATHPETGQNRVTITGPTINASRKIVFMITGESKSDVMRQLTSQTGDWQSYPTSHIGSDNPEALHYFLDQAAEG